MKTTARFDVLRKKTLKSIFTRKNLREIWRGIARAQMRGMDVIDLHDHYDFNFTIEKRAAEICHQVLAGQYKASSPLVYKLEKKFGICRHMIIPSPADALVLQTIVESLYPQVVGSRPPDGAYYSRDRQNLGRADVDADGGYPWFVLWPKFQNDIREITENHKFLVVTDLTNYYDNIGLRELRNFIAARAGADEVLVDLLFNIVEQLCWVPDYLPSSLQGLPTTNLEAFRLLPHAFLFEIDDVLADRTGGSFVRWMDDINFGVDSREKAFTILGEINDMLKSRGLALNLSKTTIHSAEAGRRHFMFVENDYLKKVRDFAPEGKGFAADMKTFESKFKNHIKNKELKSWRSVTKRYLTLAGRFENDHLVQLTRDLYVTSPGLRYAILNYYRKLGFSKAVNESILFLLKNVKRYDDVALFHFSKLLTDMKIPMDPKGRAFVAELTESLLDWKTDFDFYATLWFGAKYFSPERLLEFLESDKKHWVNEPFLARQAVSVLPKTFLADRKAALKLVEEQMVSGPTDASSAASNIHYLAHAERINKKLRSYLFPQRRQSPYPLPKSMILIALWTSPNLSDNERTKCDLNAHLDDDWHLKPLLDAP